MICIGWGHTFTNSGNRISLQITANMNFTSATNIVIRVQIQMKT